MAPEEFFFFLSMTPPLSLFCHNLMTLHTASCKRMANTLPYKGLKYIITVIWLWMVRRWCRIVAESQSPEKAGHGCSHQYWD
jgi:hypothetical protein